MEKIILLGGGGHCKSIIDSILGLKQYEIAGIIDIESNIGKVINGIPIIDCDMNLGKYKELGIDNAFLTVGSIGDTSVRRKLYDMAKYLEFKFPVIADKTSIISNDVIIDEGTFVGKGSIINSDCYIGKNCIINTGSIIEHECSIGKFVHISPGAVLCGNVKVGNYTHIGANSTIIQGKSIGNNVIVGAGSVVTKNIFDLKKSYGNPCREVE